MGFWDWLWKKESTDGAGFSASAPFVPPPSLPRAQPPAVPAPSLPPRYSVENAIELMRTLPFDDDPELVLRVVRKTLRSTGVSVEEVIGSAKSRESALTATADGDRAAIEQLEREIAARRENIARVEADLNETRTVRERLEDAIETETRVGPVVPGEEIARLHAESATAASRKPPPLAPPKVSSPAAPKTSMPPLPKVGAPSVPKKSFAPKAQTSSPPKSLKPIPMPPAPPAPPAPLEDNTDALPVLDEADASGEETARYITSDEASAAKDS